MPWQVPLRPKRGSPRINEFPRFCRLFKNLESVDFEARKAKTVGFARKTVLKLLNLVLFRTQLNGNVGYSYVLTLYFVYYAYYFFKIK